MQLEVDTSTYSGANSFEQFKRDIIKWHSFQIEKKEVLNFLYVIFFLLPVTTGKDGRHKQPGYEHPNQEIYHPWKIHDSIFHSLCKNGKPLLNLSTPYLMTGIDFFSQSFDGSLDISSVYNLYWF